MRIVRWFRRLSVAWKINAIVMFIVGMSMVVAFGVFIAYDARLSRSTLSRDLAALAELAAVNSAAAVARGDVEGATSALRALAVDRDVAAAGIVLPDGRVFAGFERDPAGLDRHASGLSSPPAWPLLAGRSLRVSHPVMDRGATVATVWVAADTDRARARAVALARVPAIVLFATFWLVLALSMRFQRVISRPIRDLTAPARAVTDEHRYDLRGAKPAGSRALFAVIENDSSTLTVPPGPARPTATSFFDLADLERTMDGDQSLVREMVKIFLDDCPLQMAALKAAVDARDPVQIRTTAHALKGSAGYLRATQVFEAARNLEALGREGALAEADTVHQHLVVEIARLVEELRKVQASADN
jgi:HPt (histidine-containing phosphotransfer) domain-containing protein